MVEIKTILLPTDGSESSDKALAYALSFARQYGARVVILHVIEMEALVGAEPHLLHLSSFLEERARRILEKAVASANQAGVHTEARVVTGIPFDDIVRLSKELPADLIILGTHGRTGLPHALMGSVAEKVVRLAPCPVLTVRQASRDFIAA